MTQDPVAWINPAEVRELLAQIRTSLRKARLRLDSPLVALHPVTLRLEARRDADTPERRAGHLVTYINELVWRELGARSRPRRERPWQDMLAQALPLLREDFGQGDTELQAWSWLHYRYLADATLSVSEVAQLLSFNEKTLQRRLDVGLAALARLLLAEHLASADAVARRPGAPPAERVLGSAGAPMGQLLRSVRAAPGRKGGGAAGGIGSAAEGDDAEAGEAEGRSAEERVQLLAERLMATVRDDAAVLRLAEGDLRAIAARRAGDWDAYRAGRFAAWALARYALDRRFVALTLLLDQGEQAAERWAAKGGQHDDLRAVLAAALDPALVLLGAPGSGKSTLLRRLEMDLAAEGLRGESDTLTFHARLSGYRPTATGAPPAPLDWLAAEWSARHGDLGALPDLMLERPLLLLLDGLNEMPHDGPRTYHERVGAWRSFLQELVACYPRTRVLISCRSLDYSAPLSSQSLRVPQLRVEPLDDAQIQDFLDRHLGAGGPVLWSLLEGTPQLDVLRVPYFLRLLVDQAEAGEPPTGRAALLTGLVRQGLRRELERGNPLFLPDGLLTERDCSRLNNAQQWRTPWELPERGKLIPKLAALAQGMQERHRVTAGAQARLPYDAALDLLDDSQDKAILRAGEALTVLDDDRERDEVSFFHQLLQEYFAARELAKVPRPALVAQPWRAVDIRPGVPELLASLDPSETLPPLPQTGWEETTLLAVAMAADPSAQVGALMDGNLALAGRAAGQPELAGRLDEALLARLRWALAERSRSGEADLRHRIACAEALGPLGDPRWERREGPHGAYLLGPKVDVPGGVYPIGDDEPISYDNRGRKGTTAAHVPRHTVEVAAFKMACFPVTNAEYACFIAAGGYRDERWWATEDARRWLRGEIANEGAKQNNRHFRQRFFNEEGLFERMEAEGGFPNTEALERWRRWIHMDDAAFEAELAEKWKGVPQTEPAFWGDARLNSPTQPVVGVNWYEARAYAAWLSAQTGEAYRLPTEVEWEAAARGPQSRAYAWGHGWVAALANTYETGLRRSSPVGVYVEGDSPEGLSDLSGNVNEWTASMFGQVGDIEDDVPDFAYPYRAGDGREDPNAARSVSRVLRGGSWFFVPEYARAAFRLDHHPGGRYDFVGFRVVVAAAPIL